MPRLPSLVVSGSRSSPLFLANTNAYFFLSFFNSLASSCFVRPSLRTDKAYIALRSSAQQPRENGDPTTFGTSGDTPEYSSRNLETTCARQSLSQSRISTLITANVRLHLQGRVYHNMSYPTFWLLLFQALSAGGFGFSRQPLLPN